MFKVSLTIALFVSAISAGDMDNGGYQCPPEGCPPPCTVNCGAASQASATNQSAGTVTTTDSIFVFVKKYLRLYF